MPRAHCAPRRMRWPATRSAPSCWKSGAKRASSISSPAASSRSQPKPPASPPCCCGSRRSLRPRPRRPDGSCVRRIRRPAHLRLRGARRCSTRSLFVTVMARSGDGSWNGNVMSAFSVNRRRILSLWLPRLPIDRIKRQLARESATKAFSSEVGTGSREENASKQNNDPSVVVVKQNNALQIFAMDDAAARFGLDVGLPLAHARAICPQFMVFDADEVADANTLNDIADWCDRFTPLVALDPPHRLSLDITGCDHLFGGEAALMRTLCGVLSAQGFAVSAAIAGTSICARTMT